MGILAGIALAAIGPLAGPAGVPAHAQQAATATPDNATDKRYGEGWTCDRGFRASADGCEAIAIPDNAYPTGSAYGPGWACSRGYRKSRDLCIAIPVPANAYLTSGGDRWVCERGFRRSGNSCEVIAVPDNAYLTGSAAGSGWTCERGFRPVRERCEPVAVPENAHLDRFGTDWECDPPYVRVADSCRLE
jgi:hypothetical protein